MTPERRLSWRCKKCITKSSTPLAASFTKSKQAGKTVKNKKVKQQTIIQSPDHKPSDGFIESSDTPLNPHTLDSSKTTTPKPSNNETLDPNEEHEVMKPLDCYITEDDILQLSIIQNSDGIATRRKSSDTSRNILSTSSGPSNLGQDKGHNPKGEREVGKLIESQTCAADILKLSDSCHYNSDNVTTRRKEYIVNVPTKNSFDSLSSSDTLSDEDEFHPINETSRCFPRSKSCLDLDEIEQKNELESLKEQVASLKTKLQSAENEIESMLSENCNLKLEVNKYAKKVEQLTKLCLNTNIPNRIKRKKSKNFQNNNLTMPNIEVENADTKNLSDAHRQISETAPPLSMNGENNNLQKDSLSLNDLAKRNVKLCLVSNVQNKNYSKKLRNCFGELDMCHYRVPGGGVSELLSGLDDKLKNFTTSDYCIIVLAETDFIVSKNYICLVKEIREKLLTMQHTTIIICLPTFKCCEMANIYNGRIEMFNYLLYQDNNNYEYCYLLDSNKHLEYSQKMFLRNGTINNQGIRVFINDICDLVLAIANVTIADESCSNIDKQADKSRDLNVTPNVKETGGKGKNCSFRV